MADPQDQESTPLDPSFYTGINFLGRPTSVSLLGQEPGQPSTSLAAGGAPIGAPRSAVIAGSGGGAADVAGTSPKSSVLNAVLKNIDSRAIANLFSNPAHPTRGDVGGAGTDQGPNQSLSDQLRSAVGAGAGAAPVGTIPVGGPEVITPGLIPGTGVSGQDIGALSFDFGPGQSGAAGATTDAAAASAPSIFSASPGAEPGALSSIEALGPQSALQLLGDVAPYAGGLFSLVSDVTGDLPTQQKVINSAVDAAALGAIPFTAGLSEVAAPFLKADLNRAVTDAQKGDLTKLLLLDLNPLAAPLMPILDILEMAGVDLFGTGPSRYTKVRSEAAGEANTDISNLSSAYQAAAQSGDLGQVLTALGTREGDRGAVRTDLGIPSDLYNTLKAVDPSNEQFGPDLGPKASGTQYLSWGNLSPKQFSSLLDYYRANPDAIGQTIRGSGDVAYLGQSDAEAVAASAKKNAEALINYVLQSSQPEAAAAAASPAAAAALGPTPGLFETPPTIAGGVPQELEQI